MSEPLSAAWITAAETWLSGYETQLALRLAVALGCGLLIGSEREFRNKPAGISTQSLVIGGAATFSFVAMLLNPADPTRIAAQVVSGIGFLGAGVILRTDHPGEVTNLTTAASVWFAASVGMLIGFGWYALAGLATLYAVCVPRIPRVRWQKVVPRASKESQR